MVLKALLISLALIFVAELGDKTQLTVLALSARFKKPLQVFVGAAVAFAILNGIAVGLGEAGTLLPADLIRLLASLIFVGVGLASLNSARKAEEEGAKEAGEEKKIASRYNHGPMITTFLLICLMELGDKTQLSMIALTTRFHSPLSVFVGGTLALWLSALLASLVGVWLARVVPVKTIRAISGGLFILFGLLTALHAY
jgi:putative Ca2+/H+ antiporter (TMEM165/GDT1 family)